MNLKRFAALPFGLTLALLSLASTGHATTPPFRLLTPFNGAVVHGAEILVVFTVPPGTKFIVQLDGKNITTKNTPVPGNNEDLHHLRLDLSEGRHKIRLLDAGTENELDALSLTYIPPSSFRTTTDKEDRLYAFHTPERETLCKGCHSLPETFETVSDRPMAPAGKVCGACHPAIEAAPHRHGPVAVYECFKCHGAEFTPSRFTQKTSQGASCSSCHQEFLSRILGSSKFVHGPVAAGVCLVCHDPHGARTADLLVEQPQALCRGCHAQTLPLPLEKGLHAKLPCTKCHNPHGAQEQHLTSSTGNQFCKNCHTKVGAGQAGHPIPGHPVEAPVDRSKPGQPMGCRSCHDPHGLKDISKADIQHNDAVQRQFCRRCHY